MPLLSVGKRSAKGQIKVSSLSKNDRTLSLIAQINAIAFISNRNVLDAQSTDCDRLNQKQN